MIIVGRIILDPSTNVRGEREEEPLPLIDLDELGATAVAMTNCGGECGSITLPSGFAFPYFGQRQSAINVSIHGFVAFEELDDFSSYYFTGDCIGGHLWSAPELAIAPYWGDFSFEEADSGIYWADGTDLLGRRYAVIEWRSVTHFWEEGIATFQLVLWDDGTFDFRYGPMIGDDVNGESGAIGHFDDDAYDAYELLCEESISGGLSDRAFRHYGPPPATGSAEIVVDQTGDYELCVLGYAGDTACQTITVTVSP